MHLGITGTKKGMTEAQFDVIKGFIFEDAVITHLHEGDCVGVDNQVTLMFQDLRPEVWIVRHPPKNTKYQAFGPYDETTIPKDYLVRDQDNVNESDYLWAAPNGVERMRGSGTWATVRMARKKGIPITIIMPNGEIIYE
jgi:hypothetical protein